MKIWTETTQWKYGNGRIYKKWNKRSNKFKEGCEKWKKPDSFEVSSQAKQHSPKLWNLTKSCTKPWNNPKILINLPEVDVS